MIKSFPHEYFMSIALKEAGKALLEDEVPIGAVIVIQNQVIGKGYNQVERLRDATAHAEIIAITAASNYFNNKYLPGCTIYITIEPCMMCASAIGWAQIGKVVYGASDPKKGFTLFHPSPLHPKSMVESGVMGDECGLLLTEFFRKKRDV
jgi:tRNA(adenine34) deaminase